MSATPRLEVGGLTRLEALELADALKRAGVEGTDIRHAPLARGNAGELATATAVVIVSLAALRVLAVYLAKDRVRRTVDKVVTTTAPDGTIREERTAIALEKSASDEDVVKQLAAATNVDVKDLR